MPTMLRMVSEMEIRSAGTGGAFSPLFGAMNVEPLGLVSASLTDGSRMGEVTMPESVGLSEAEALPAKCGRYP